MLILKEDHPMRGTLPQSNNIFTPQQAEQSGLPIARIGFVNVEPNMLMGDTRNAFQFLGSDILVDFVSIHMESHKRSGRNVQTGYVENYCHTFNQAILGNDLDGLIISGVAERLERMEFGEIDFWREYSYIIEFAQACVPVTMYQCWAVVAAMNVMHGVPKAMYPQKLTGLVDTTNVTGDQIPFTVGLNKKILLPHSRNTTPNPNSLRRLFENGDLIPLLKSNDKPTALNGHTVGVCTFTDRGNRSLYNLGHIEYRPEYIHQEVERDIAAGILYPVHNYYQSDMSIPGYSWESDGKAMFENFLKLALQRDIRMLHLS